MHGRDQEYLNISFRHHAWVDGWMTGWTDGKKDRQKDREIDSERQIAR
jgi:hypothetical protein